MCLTIQRRLCRGTDDVNVPKSGNIAIGGKLEVATGALSPLSLCRDIDLFVLPNLVVVTQ